MAESQTKPAATDDMLGDNLKPGLADHPDFVWSGNSVVDVPPAVTFADDDPTGVSTPIRESVTLEAQTPKHLWDDGMPPKAPKVAIVGFAQGHYDQAPFDDPEFEIWGINSLHKMPGIDASKFDRWFNLHDLEKFHGEDEEHLKFLRNFKGEVVMRLEDVGVLGVEGVPFPRKDMVKLFGTYFNNTVSWLIALAIAMEYETIALYGVDMAQDGIMNAEYSHQRPSCEFFLGVAAGRGIEIVIPNGSDLLKTTHLYGWEDADAWTMKILSRLKEVGKRKEELKGQLAQLDAQREQLVAGINQLDGAMQDNQFWLRNYAPNPHVRST